MNLATSIALVVLTFAAEVAAAASPVVRDANGLAIGYYAGQAYIGPGYDTGLLVVSSTGYVFAIDDADSTLAFNHAALANKAFLADVHYVSNNCTGAGYAVYASGAPIAGGFVMRMSDGIAYFAAKGTSTQQIFTSSRMTSGGCVPFAAQSFPGIPVLANDPVITGVPASIPNGAPEIVISTFGNDLFRDGFETAIETNEPIMSPWIC